MELQFLYELQRQEYNYNKLETRISELCDDTQINRLKVEYANLKEEYISMSAKKADVESKICQKKSHQKMLEESKANYEKLIYTPEINSVKKFETLEKQIDDVQKNIELETCGIEDLRKNSEDIAAQISSIKKKMIFIKKKYEALKTSKKEELDFLLNEKEIIQELIKDIKQNIDENLYNEYCKMKERLNSPIAEIENRKCSGCSMEVPILDYETVKSGKSLKCQNCGRILIYKKNK